MLNTAFIFIYLWILYLQFELKILELDVRIGQTTR